MKVLLTNHQLADFAGSEMYTYELAKGLQRAGHTVTVYSKYTDKVAELFEEVKIQVVSDLASISDEHFDIAHVHHNINALEVRNYFPQLPIFFLAHGTTAFLELPPQLDINITQYGSISSRVKEANLRKHGIPAHKIITLKGIVDETRFFPSKPLSEKPKRALVISNHLTEKTVAPIRTACEKKGIELVCVGRHFSLVSNFELPTLINQADIVFTLGRGAIETMLCGRIPIILDYKGGDGMVTPENYSQLEKFHFNGNYSAKRFTTRSIMKEIDSYQSENGARLQEMTRRQYGVQVNVKRLERIYQRTIENFTPKQIDAELLAYFVKTVQVTRLHTFSTSELHLTLGDQLRLLKRTLRSLLPSPRMLWQ